MRSPVARINVPRSVCMGAAAPIARTLLAKGALQEVTRLLQKMSTPQG